MSKKEIRRIVLPVDSNIRFSIQTVVSMNLRTLLPILYFIFAQRERERLKGGNILETVLERPSSGPRLVQKRVQGTTSVISRDPRENSCGGI